jgi:hypothetical protein
MFEMVDGTGIIGVDMICPLGVSTPQPPNYDRVELEGTGVLVLPNSLNALLERLELGGKTEQVQTTGKNLFDFSNLESGRINISTGALEEHNYTRRLADYIDITGITSFSVYLPGYNKANGAVYVVIYYYDKDKKYLSYRACGDKQEKYENIAPAENAVYIKVTLEQNTTDNPQNIFKVQLEKGAKSTDYEPYTGGKPSPSQEYQQKIKNVGKWNEAKQKYEVDVKITNAEQNWNKEQSLTLTSDRPITKWDKLVEQGGQIGWLYNSVNETIDGKTGKWSIQPANKIFYRTDITFPIVVPFCIELLGYDYSMGGYKKDTGITINNLGILCITLPEEVELTLDAYKQYLADNPLHVLYKGDSEEFIPLQQSEQNAIRALKTYYPTTVITADGGEFDPDIKVTYRKEI